VAEELHFGRAAERLYVAQPVLSRQIQKFEQELGVELFRRTSRQVELTAAGARLLEEGPPLLAAADALRRSLAADAPAFTIGFFIGDATVTRAIRAFSERHPDLTVDVHRIYWSDQAQVLLDGAADVAFVHLPIDETGLTVVPLYAEERVALLSAAHPLATRAELSIRDLADDPVILHRDATAAWEAFHNTDPRPDGHRAVPGPTVDNFEEKLEVVAVGRGISFLPRSVAAAVRIKPEVVTVPMTDIPPTQVCLAYARETPLVADFVAVTKESVERVEVGQDLVG
jgi:DNA-binding transcriptional LysR family regulator